MKRKQQKILPHFIIFYNPLELPFFYESLEHVVIVYTYCSLKFYPQKVLSTETDIFNKACLIPIKDFSLYDNSLYELNLIFHTVNLPIRIKFHNRLSFKSFL